MIKNILFDVDGTLVDSVEAHARAWAEAFEKFGAPQPFEAVRAQIGKGGENIVKALLTPSQAASFGAELRSWREKRFIEAHLDGVRPFPRVRDLFLTLKREGKRVALASSAKPSILDRTRALIAVDDLIEATVSGGDVKRSKPSPDIFHAALEKLGAQPAESIVVGDSTHDAAAAAAAGMQTVGLLCGGFEADVLREAGCIAIYKDPSDLLENISASPLLGAAARR